VRRSPPKHPRLATSSHVHGPVNPRCKTRGELCAGVPKFFRWLAERYPLTLQKYQDGAGVAIDNLYLDMNGIIHNCTHANEAKVDATEEEMVHRIFLYIERLVRIAKPQKVLFMAIDGATCSMLAVFRDCCH
jgi:XRN 5'-3' exonuclease N-terminus